MHVYIYIYIYIYIYRYQTSMPMVQIGGAVSALKFQCARRISLSGFFLSEKLSYNQCKSQSLSRPRCGLR